MEDNGVRILKLPKPKSRMILGHSPNIIFETDIKFNKLQKYMWKKFFNVKVEEVED